MVNNDICFFGRKDCLFFRRVSLKSDLMKEDVCDGYLIDTGGDEKEVRRIVDCLKGKGFLIGVMGYDNVFNRRVIETMKINFLVGIEVFEKRDGIKQRDSGLNHVVAKIAKKNKVSFVFDINFFRNLNPKKKAILLSRFIQNIRVCRKAGCGIRVASFAKSEKEIFSKKAREIFLFSLGASSQQVKESCNFKF